MVRAASGRRGRGSVGQLRRGRAPVEPARPRALGVRSRSECTGRPARAQPHRGRRDRPGDHQGRAGQGADQHPAQARGAAPRADRQRRVGVGVRRRRGGIRRRARVRARPRDRARPGRPGHARAGVRVGARRRCGRRVAQRGRRGRSEPDPLHLGDDGPAQGRHHHVRRPACRHPQHARQRDRPSARRRDGPRRLDGPRQRVEDARPLRPRQPQRPAPAMGPGRAPGAGRRAPPHPQLHGADDDRRPRRGGERIRTVGELTRGDLLRRRADRPRSPERRPRHVRPPLRAGLRHVRSAAPGAGDARRRPRRRRRPSRVGRSGDPDDRDPHRRRRRDRGRRRRPRRAGRAGAERDVRVLGQPGGHRRGLARRLVPHRRRRATRRRGLRAHRRPRRAT